MEKEQKERFEQALERKQEDAERKAQANQPAPGSAPPDADGSLPDHEHQLIGDDRPQDTLSVRDKNTGKGKKTADKWNQ